MTNRTAAHGTLVGMVGNSSTGASPTPASSVSTSTVAPSNDEGLASTVGTDQRPPAPYSERLAAPLSWWLAATLVIGVTCFLVPLRGQPWLAVPGGIAGVALGAVLVYAYGSVRLRIDRDAQALVAGGARIPLSALGEVCALDAEQARALRGVDADPRAFMLLRSYVRTAVRVEVTDPKDPTPYLYLSTRHPDQLVAALTRQP